MTKRHGIAFAPMHNTGRKKDATHAFIPEARRFVARHGGRVILIDNKAGKVAQRQRVIEVLRGEKHLEYVAFFCHGYAKGIQLGFRLDDVQRLAESIALSSKRDVRVPLYCCSTASTTRQLLRLGKGPGGDGGFADSLRDALVKAGRQRCVVDAHVTVGHTTKNPHVRRFEGYGDGIGGEYIVEPRAKLWRAWVRYLRTDGRFDFPWVSTALLRRQLELGA